MSDSREFPGVPPATLRVTTDDGVDLGASWFEPHGPAQGAVIIHGATATPQGFYRSFAAHLSARGYGVLTYDYRGIGASRPRSLRGFHATMTDWATLDAPAALGATRARAQQKPVFAIGHSFGGQAFGVSDALHDVDALLLVGAQLGSLRHWPTLAERARLAAIWHVAVPALTAAYGYLPGNVGIGEELPAGVAREWARWCRHPEYLMGYVPGSRERFARFRKPALLVAFDDDDFAPEPAVDALARAFSGARLELRRRAPHDVGGVPIGHFGFFRRRFAGSLWRDADAFFDDRALGRPWSPEPRGSPAAALSQLEVMADLAYGRA